MKRFAYIAVALGLLAAPAAAQTPQFYIGVHGGKTLAVDQLSDTGGNFSLDGAGMSGYTGGVHIGVDLQMRDSPVFFGIYGGADTGSTEFNLQSGSSTFTAKIGNSWYTGGRIGGVIYGVKLYGLAAYRQAEWDSTVAELTSPTLKGYDLGIGAEFPIAKNVSFGIEGISTHYQRSEFQYAGSPTGMEHELQTLGVMARLNFTLGGGSIFDDRVDPPKVAAPRDPKDMGKR